VEKSKTPPGPRLYINVMRQLLIREYHIYIVTAEMDMERIRQLARELNIDVVNQGIACLPQYNWKYAGSVTGVNRARGNEAWVVRIRQGDFRYQKTFTNEAEANANLRNIKVRENFEIKNCFKVFQDCVEVQLTHGRYFKCDIEDLNTVEGYVWGARGGRSVTTKHGEFALSFHNIVMNHIPTRCIIVYHIDTNPLNCCKSNLCLVDKRTKNINCSMGKNNTSGIVGVNYDQRNDCWVVTWSCEHGSRNAQVYTVYRHGFERARELAIRFRARMERELPHYANALRLNEPDDDDDDQ